MTAYHIKTGDTAPRPRTVLIDGAGAPVNLTGATVRLKAFTAPGVTPKIDAVATVVDAVNGLVEYAITATDTNTAETYLAEWQVTYGGGAVQTFPGDGYDLLVVAADLDATEAQGTGYCSVAQARAAGAEGSNAAVQAAIASAELRVNRYTGVTWGRRSRTVVVTVGDDGRALLPAPIDTAQTIAVRAVGATSDLAPTAYQVTSSDVQGQLDAIYLGWGGSDPLVVGAEPWSGGWAGFLAGLQQVQVTATMGEVIPPEVADATALLAANITGGTSPGTPVGTADLDADDEGNAVTISPAADPAEAVRTRSTGLALADDLLEPLVVRRVRVS